MGATMASEPVTTLYDYQLSMLHAMCMSAPAEAADLLDRIGATRADTAIAEKRWWFTERTNNLRSIAEYVTAWGAPASEDVHPNGDVRYARWDLSFWPGLQIELMEINRVNLYRTFVRRPDVPQPRLGTLADLTPWSCTYGELEHSGFGPLRSVTGMGAVGDVSSFIAVDPDSGRERTYWANFDWSLLQSVEPAPDDYAWKHWGDHHGITP
jgi:hypothetical protein